MKLHFCGLSASPYWSAVVNFTEKMLYWLLTGCMWRPAVLQVLTFIMVPTHIVLLVGKQLKIGTL